MTVKMVPWVRSGLALDATNGATHGATDVVRATARIEIAATANDGDIQEAVPGQDVQLFGPGDIASIDEGQIRHRYPSPNAPDAEWNFFAFVELAEADLPWRYSPAGPGSDGIAPPWLALVVVEEGGDEAEFDAANRLPLLTVHSAASLTPPADLWAWAHAFGEGDPTVDDFSARVMCPRRLLPHRHWRACLVPAFMTGRNAGRGLPPGDDPGPAWREDEIGVELPVYATWTFHTGDRDGTFLSLAQKLTARELGPGVGVRPLDLSEPGTPLPHSDGARTDFVGAMYSPQYDPAGRTTADLDEFARTYRAELNRGDDEPADANGAYEAAIHDPVVRLPRYASPQRQGEPLADQADHWYARVNTRPENRTVAALGASVVRNDQEDLLAAAWEHAASLTQINESLQRARLAEEMAQARRHKFAALDAAQQFQLTGPAAGSISTESGDLVGLLADAAVSPVVAGGSFRRMTRPGGVFQRATTTQPALATTPAPAENFVATTLDVGAAAFTSPQPNLLPAGLDVGQRVDAPVAITGTLDVDAFEFLDLDLAVPIAGGISSVDVTWASSTAGLAIGRVATTSGSSSAPSFAPASGQLVAAPAAASTGSPGRVPVRRSTRRRVVAPTPRFGQATAVLTPGTFVGEGLVVTPQSVEPFPPGWAIDNNIPVGDVLTEIRDVILDEDTYLVAQRPGDVVRRGTVADPLPTFDADIGALMADAIDPAVGVRAWVDIHIARRRPDGTRLGVIRANESIPTALVARPSFHVPMYERLRALSVEYVVPGVADVPDNTVGALSVNTAFVESFLLGANHELSREFRWREYPAPLHLTWFDQFWDVGPDGPPDIPAIDGWGAGPLGSHAAGGDRLVVLVKGELIDRFPNLSVYMAQAHTPGIGQERVMADLPPVLPSFAGKLMPGLYFYGFDLFGGADPSTTPHGQVHEAQFGGAADQGWFFGLEEQPRSPRFGLNVGNSNDEDGPIQVGTAPDADEAYMLSWKHMKRTPDDAPRFVSEGATPQVMRNRTFDEGTWFSDAATMAAITFRRPTRVLIHATALLGED